MLAPTHSVTDATGTSVVMPQRLVDLLLGAQLVTRAQLDDAEEERSKTGEFLCKILVQRKYTTQDDINTCFVKQCKIPHISLLDYDVGSEVLKLISKEVCLKYGLLPIDKLGRILTVAMVDPLDNEALEAIRTLCPDLRIKPILCNWTHFEQAAQKYFADSQKKESQESMASFGLTKLAPKPTPKPAPASAPPLAAASTQVPSAPVAAIDTGALVGAIQAGLRDVVQELSARMAPTQSEPVSAAPALSPEVLGGVMRDSIRDAMAEALKNFERPAAEVVPQPPAAPVAPPAPAFSPEVLGNVMRDSVRDAMAEALRTLDRPSTNIAPAILPATAAAPDWSGFEQAFRATLDELKEIVRPKETAALVPPPPVEPAGPGMEAVLQELISAIKGQTPAADAMGETIRESIGGAMQEALASVVVQLRASAKPDQAPPPFEQFAEMIRDTIGGVMQEALATLIVQMRTNSAQNDHGAAAQEAIVLALRDSQQGMVATMKEVIEASRDAQAAQSARLAELAEAAVQSSQQTSQLIEAAVQSTQQTSQLVEASLVQNERMHNLRQGQRSRHASVSSFGVPVEGEAADMAGDDRVRDALEAEVPLETLTFESFFAGKANAFTLSIAQSVAAKPGGEYNPLFLYGNVGLGKTHLISAAGNAIRQNHPKHRVGYVSASHFSRRLKEALAADAQEAFRENYCHWDVLILDDIQFMGGRVEAQEEFFHIFNVLHQQGRQIIIASDKAPDRLGLLEQRLISRFSSGIVADLKAPEWDTRMQILRRHAGTANVQIPDEILSLIAMRVSNDIRKMVGSLRKIAAFAAMSREPLTVELATEILSHLGGEEAA
ncbi:MAG: ATP-binding protein [Candidatus Hydrogenedentes bacterium]|nr:ATP-binding protein [Candidatus Hydrogenedentota bacterium]